MRLQLLPEGALTGLAFSAGSVEHYSFMVKPVRFTPATLTIEWYQERSNPGHYEWSVKAVGVPPGDKVDIPPGNLPQLFIPDQKPDFLAELGVSFSKCIDAAILIIYRDSTNPVDTAIGHAMVTDIYITWEGIE